MDETDLIKHSKIVHTVPSQMGKLSKYRTLQENQVAKTLDDRPEQDSVPPHPLYMSALAISWTPSDVARRSMTYLRSGATWRHLAGDHPSASLAPATRRLARSGRSRTRLVICYPPKSEKLSPALATLWLGSALILAGS